MFRRRTSRTNPLDRVEATPAPTETKAVSNLAAGLGESGWLLPRSLDRARGAHWTLVGTVASDEATPVDQAGLVVGDGWSLDWWVGADDRWHLPAREVSVRQQLLDDTPVLETLLRVPGGDAIHRAYGIRSPRPVGDEWVIAEVENATPIPFAVALVIRPFVADAVGTVNEITLEAVEGGSGRDIAHLVRVDGRPAVVVPRRPARVAAGNAARGDVVDQVVSGDAGGDLMTVSCDQGLATLALVFPLTHTSVLRAAVPVGEAGTASLAYPLVMPDATKVASGWEVHRRGPRISLPDQRLTTAFERARTHIQLAHDGVVVRRDGSDADDLDPGATELILGAFDLLDRPADAGTVMARWLEQLIDPAPSVDAMVLSAVARHWRLHRVTELLDWMLPEVAAAVERLDRADRKGRLGDPVDRFRAAEGLDDAVALLGEAGQPEAASAVTALARRVADGAVEPVETAADRLMAVARAARAPEPEVSEVLKALDAVFAAGTATSTWPGPVGQPGLSSRRIGHDLAASAAVVHVVRSLLVAERPDGLALVPLHPDSWYGGEIELHDAPTAWGRFSFAVRWHGTRPALLWDLEPHPGVDEVRLSAPALDPEWSSTERRGEALLAQVRPPDGLRSLQVVAEHPDIDPSMRRPGAAPDPAGPLRVDDEGGTFS